MFGFSSIDAALSAWSVFIQLSINIPLFVLFLISWFTTKKKIFFTWTIAWIINLIALCNVLVVSNFFVNTNSYSQLFFYGCYGSSKILFGVFLLFSAIQFSRRYQAINIPYFIMLIIWLFLFFLFLFMSPVLIQFFVYLIVSILLYLGFYFCLKKNKYTECRVISLGFFIEASMFLHHFIVILFAWVSGKSVPTYMSRISFFDSISEFVLALTFLLGVILRIINELRDMNHKLENNQESLRNLVEADPLTGLKNRRVLRKFFERIKGKNGCIAFIDINKFKQINDNWGHGVGDRCLIELAAKMKNVFRVEDGLFRLGGDEFLIVCPNMSGAEMRKRIERLRNAIKNSLKGIVLTIAVGIEPFNVTSHIDEVLKTADEKMYTDKCSNS